MKLRETERRAADPAHDGVSRKAVLAFGTALALGLLLWVGIYQLIF